MEPRSRPGRVMLTYAAGAYSAASFARWSACTRWTFAHRREAPPSTHPRRIISCRRGAENAVPARPRTPLLHSLRRNPLRRHDDRVPPLLELVVPIVHVPTEMQVPVAHVGGEVDDVHRDLRGQLHVPVVRTVHRVVHATAVPPEDELGEARGFGHANAPVTRGAVSAPEQRLRRRIVQIDVEVVREHEFHESERVPVARNLSDAQLAAVTPELI